MKPRTNQGVSNFAFFDLKINATTKARGTKKRVLPSFTVVATAADSSPYIAAVATTELVSCIAKATQAPNSS